MIVGHAQPAQCLSALRLYEEAQNALAQPTLYLYPSTLKACGDLGHSQQGRVIHHHVIRHGLETEVVIGSALVDMYSKCRHLEDAHALFDRLPAKNIVTWGALIAGYAQHGYASSASDLFSRMMREGIRPNRVLLLSVLKGCASKGSLQEGRLLHDKSYRDGLESDLAIGNTLVVMYSKGGSLEEADKVFRDLRGRNVVSWCAMISGRMRQNQGHLALKLYEEMNCSRVEPNTFVFSCVLKACGSIGASNEGKAIHDQVVRNVLELDTVIGSSLIDMYAECGLLSEAEYVLDRLQARNIVSWNVMLCGYAHHGQLKHALHLFERMNFEKVQPNKATYLYVMQACGDCGAVVDGKAVHAHLFESGVEMDAMVGSSLINMYIMCGSLEEAKKVFDKTSKRNVIVWSAMIRGYTCHGHDLYALQLFENMQEEGVKPDKVTFMCVVKAVGTLEMIKQGVLLHDQIVLSGFECDVMVANSIMHMYCSCGRLESACGVFDRMLVRDVASWSAVITGLTIHGNVPAAFGYFTQMHHEGKKPDKVTVLCILKACGIIGALEQGKLLHDYIQRNDADSELAVGNTLVDMYARCGSMEDASKVFSTLIKPDIISWGALIAGYAEHGCFGLAWECLEKVEREGLKPNSIMFTSILSACGRAGHVEAAHRYFWLMVEHYGIMPSFEHVNCMADLLGHSGRLEDATLLLRSMPNQPDLTGWMSLLTACRTHSNKELGQQSFAGVSQQDLGSAAGYAFLADIYMDVQDSEAACRLQELRANTKAWKKPGKAWLETRDNLQEFIVGDRTHPLHEKIYNKLKSLQLPMKGGGYLPQFDLVTAQRDVWSIERGNLGMESHTSLSKPEKASASLKSCNVSYNLFKFFEKKILWSLCCPLTHLVHSLGTLWLVQCLHIR